MPHGKPLGQPDSYLSSKSIGNFRGSMLPCNVFAIYIRLCAGQKIGVHYRPKRDRYTINGEPISRRMIDRLVYFGVIDEDELRGNSNGKV